MERLAAHGLEVTATTLQANRLRPLAGGHRLAAENPVTVIVGRRDRCQAPLGWSRRRVQPRVPARGAARADRGDASRRGELVALATVDRRAEEPCMLAAAEHFGVPLRTHAAEALADGGRADAERRRRAPRRHAERRRGRGAARPARALLVPKTPFRTRNLRGGRMPRVIHPIEVESYRILRVAHRPQPPAAALARGRRAGDPRRRGPVVRREPRPRRSGAGAGPRSAAQRRAGLLRRAHGRRRHHVAPADRPARRPARQDARPGPDPLGGRDAAGHEGGAGRARSG